MLEEFEGTQIFIPKDMTMIQSGKLSPYEIQQGTPVFIVYVSPDECSSCRISHLDKYEDLFLMAKSMDFDVMIILSPTDDQIEYIQDQLIQSRFSHPVYLDSYSEFSGQNKIPEDKRFHSFLINSDLYPVFVGDPTLNDKMQSILSDILTER